MSEIVNMWLNKRCGSENSKIAYRYDFGKFLEYAQTTPEEIVNAWSKVRYDLRLRQEFADEWTSKIESYVYGKNDSSAPKSKARKLAVISSFFHCLKVDVSPEQVKKTFVKYHNRDISKTEIRTLLENSNLRDKCFFLMMVESGQRPNTLVQLQYKHVKQDFASGKVPMKIELPSEILKDNVEARFSFLGEDGYRVLKEYLTPKFPLKDDDYLFEREKVRETAKKGVPLKTERKPYAPAGAFSMKFTGIVQRLGWETKGKVHDGVKHQLRLYTLRKFFSNNMNCDRAYVDFWFGHTLTSGYYVAHDIEEHRTRYTQGYEKLRVYRTDATVADLNSRLLEKDAQLEMLTKQIEKLQPLMKLVDVLGDEETLKKFAEEITKAKPGKVFMTVSEE